uniref:Adherance factor putative n=1 Tax=Albugo laibachii Nc14 TaxID=890382 RepID=F0WR96_9STRA|nr:adherance factor putative [Albugo laibachii Nc14]CCA24042.1 adherance factor putative [Albugo laibachii Nc14]|eukprot:CCA24042.1 adherance factor putative [Albugo laibachii Nc14]
MDPRAKLRSLHEQLASLDCRQVSVLPDMEDDSHTTSLSHFESQIPSLTMQEQEYLIEKADDSCKAVIQHGHTLSGPENWQCIGKHCGIAMYRGEAPPTADGDDTASQCTRQFVCGIMTIVGSIEDVASYFDQSTTAGMKVKQADDIVDSRALYSLVSESTERPFHRVAVKYVAWQPPAALTHTRDLCYLECQDTFEHSSGRRGWALSMHSIDIPSCPHRSGIIRCSIYNSGYVFVESENSGYLHVLHTLQINFKGHLPTFVVNQALRKRVTSMTGVRDELLFLRLSRKKLLHREELLPKSTRSTCGNCQRRFNPLFTRKTRCRVCGQVLCQKCAPMVSFKNTEEQIAKLQSMKIRVCEQCLRESCSATKFSPVHTTPTPTPSKLLSISGKAWKSRRWNLGLQQSRAEQRVSTILYETEEDMLENELDVVNVFAPPQNSCDESSASSNLKVRRPEDIMRTFLWAPSTLDASTKSVRAVERANSVRTTAFVDEELQKSLKGDVQHDDSNKKPQGQTLTDKIEWVQNMFTQSNTRADRGSLWSRLSGSTKTTIAEGLNGARSVSVLQEPRMSFSRSSMLVGSCVRALRRPLSMTALDSTLKPNCFKESSSSTMDTNERPRSLSSEKIPESSSMGSSASNFEFVNTPLFADGASLSFSDGRSRLHSTASEHEEPLNQHEPDSGYDSTDSEDDSDRLRKSSYSTYNGDDCASELSDTRSRGASILSDFWYSGDNQEESSILDALILQPELKQRGSSLDYEERSASYDPAPYSCMDHPERSVVSRTASPSTCASSTESLSSDQMPFTSFERADPELWKDSEAMRFAHEQHQSRMHELQQKLDSLEQQSCYGSSINSSLASDSGSVLSRDSIHVR